MNLRNKGINGVKWMTVSTIFITILAVLKVSVLARIIDVSDFGLMAIITFILGFMDLFIGLGLTTAILHVEKISKLEYSSLFWLNFGFSLIIFCVLFIISSIVSDFYGEPELKTLIPIMASGLVFNAIGSQFRTIEQKKLNFKLLALVDIFTSLISLIMAIVLAVYDYGVYALVYSSLFYTILGAMFYFVRGIKINSLKLHFKLLEVKPFLKIGGFNVGGQIINYFSKEVDILIVGNIFGTEVLGSYSLAKELVNRPLKIIRPVVIKVISPILSLIKNDKTALSHNYLKTVKVVSSLGICVYLTFIVFANPIVILFYGSSYDNISILVRILACYMFFVSVRIPLGSLITATGKTHMEFYWFLTTFVIMLIAVFIGSKYSIEGVATAMAGTMIIYFIPMWKFLINPLIGVSFNDYVKAHLMDFKVLREITLK